MLLWQAEDCQEFGLELRFLWIKSVCSAPEFDLGLAAALAFFPQRPEASVFHFLVETGLLQQLFDLGA